VGRRGKYTPEVVDAVIHAMELGMTDADACSVAGISEDTFYAWQRTKPEFLNRTTRARPKGWQSDLKIIREAAEKDWKAAAEHLDRTRSPYRKSQETVLTGPDGAPLVVLLNSRPDGPA
jgi:hypothetical protein